ncbi:MAG: DsrE/DsrF/DrsH-like family protein [Candidatus Jettenia sp.]|nr:DsrE/DsrF/DrsH-like family protein [Candidatus Jettenia sp.]
METDKKGLSIIFHSGSYDRIYHGFSIVLVTLALGREVRCFFTYWVLPYLVKGKPAFQLDEEGRIHQQTLEEHMRKGHMQEISELLTQAKAMGAKFFVCINSVGLLNISREELAKEVDKSMGLTTFLAEIDQEQILFIEISTSDLMCPTKGTQIQTKRDICFC